MQRRRRRSAGVEDSGSDVDGSASTAAAVSLPAAPALPPDRLGFREYVGEGAGDAVNIVPSAWPLTPFYMALYNGDPPTIKGWTPPIRARIKGLIGRWAY